MRYQRSIGADHSEVESLSKINYRTEGIKIKASVNDGEGTIRQGGGTINSLSGKVIQKNRVHSRLEKLSEITLHDQNVAESMLKDLNRRQTL